MRLITRLGPLGSLQVRLLSRPEQLRSLYTIKKEYPNPHRTQQNIFFKLSKQPRTPKTCFSWSPKVTRRKLFQSDPTWRCRLKNQQAGVRRRHRDALPTTSNELDDPICTGDTRFLFRRTLHLCLRKLTTLSLRDIPPLERLERRESLADMHGG